MLLTPEFLAQQLNYSQWASRRLLALALTIPEEEATRHILKTFQHIYYADRAWLCRIEGTHSGYEDPAPGPSLADLDRDWWPLLDRFEAAIKTVEPAAVLAYKNLKGQPFERPYWQIALHVVNHGTYHRGQVASMLRQLGHQPPSTDLIYYYLEQ
jgi:uncharacterized damage-inducible protein DinB